MTVNEQLFHIDGLSLIMMSLAGFVALSIASFSSRNPSSKMKSNTVDCLLKKSQTKNGVANENIPANRHGRKRKNSESFAIAVFNQVNCKSSWAV